MTTKAKPILGKACVAFYMILLASCQARTSNQATTANTTKEVKNKTGIEQYQEWVDKNPTSTDKTASNDQIDGSLYRNNKYNFRIRFIEGWTFRKGDSKSTVIKSVKADSGKAISVIVEDFLNIELQNKALTQQELNDQKKQIIDVMKLQNIEPTNIEIQNGFLNNFPAIIITFNSIARSQTVEIEYAHKQIHCINDSKLYNISISMPDAFYDNNENKRLNRVIESFVFEKGM